MLLFRTLRFNKLKFVYFDWSTCVYSRTDLKGVFFLFTVDAVSCHVDLVSRAEPGVEDTLLTF